MMRKTLAIIVLVTLSGCTTPATKLAIQDYRKSAQYQELAFNNSTRIANEQMLLNLCQYIKLHPMDQETTIEAVKATWSARNQLEVCREQWMYARGFAMLTYGQYLYDQQGILNVLFGNVANLAKDTSDAASAADQAAGVNSVADFVPSSVITPPTTRPATQSASASFHQLLQKITGKQ